MNFKGLLKQDAESEGMFFHLLFESLCLLFLKLRLFNCVLRSLVLLVSKGRSVFYGTSRLRDITLEINNKVNAGIKTR